MRLLAAAVVLLAFALAARAAGLPVALVRHGYTATAVESLGADALVDDLSALPALLRSLLPAGA